MTTFAHPAQIAIGNAKRVTIGSACKTAAAVAIVGMISAVSVSLLSGAPFTPAATMDLTHQTELRDLLCRIDHRCPTTGDLAARESSKSLSSAQFAPSADADLTDQSELRSLLCRIDHRCPTAKDVAREASKIRTAENTAR
jgi:hypothetical protein